MSSREVDWYEVARFVAPLIERFDSLPVPGSPAWCALSGHDPTKLAACLLVARYWALGASCRQEAQIQASQAISDSADWGAIVRSIAAHSRVHIRRRTA